MKSAKKILVLLLSWSLITGTARAELLDFDIPQLAAVLQNIMKVHESIKKMSEVVGAAKEQIQTMQQVSSGIRNLKKVLAGGVQGILGEVGQSMGLNEVFAVGKELQATVTDGMSLYRSVKELPQEAKNQLQQIGVSVADVQEYLASGLVYDAFQGMGVDQWKQVVKDPMNAFATGAVGRACTTSENYIDTTEMRKAYAEKLKNMTPEEQANMSSSIGLNMAMLNLAEWGKEMDKRIGKSLNYSMVGDKLLKVTGNQEDLLGTMKVSNAAQTTQVKIAADTLKDTNEANTQIIEGQAVGNTISDRREKRELTKREAESMSKAR